MGLGNFVSGIRNKFKKAEQQTNEAERKVVKTEGSIERSGVSLVKELQAFSSGLAEESKLIAELVKLEAEKRTVVRAKALYNAAKQNLAVSTRQLIGALDRGRNRLQMYGEAGLRTSIASAGRGMAALGSFGPTDNASRNREFQAQRERWFQEQRNLIQVLKNNTLAAVRGEEENAVSFQSVIRINNKIAGVLHSLSGVLDNQNNELVTGQKDLLFQIDRQRRMLQQENKMLGDEARELKASL